MHQAARASILDSSAIDCRVFRESITIQSGQRKRGAAVGVDRYSNVCAWRQMNRRLIATGTYQQQTIATGAAGDLKIDVAAMIGLRHDLARHRTGFARCADAKALRPDK